MMRRAAWAAAASMLLLCIVGAAAFAVSEEMEWSSGMSAPASIEDWEPSLAADHNSSTVYWFATATRPPPVCDGCPNPVMGMRTSTDNGATWSEPSYPCGSRCAGLGVQYDPAPAISGDGSLHFAFMSGWHIAVTRKPAGSSTFDVLFPCIDFSPTQNASECPRYKTAWGDKPWMVADGNDVYVFWNSKHVMSAVSHDNGATWSAARNLTDPASKLYYFPNGAAVVSPGLVCAGANAEPEHLQSSVISIFCSDDRGATWRQLSLDVSHRVTPCPAWAGCEEPQFLAATIALAADPSSSSLFALYTLSHYNRGPARPYLKVAANLTSAAMATNISSWSHRLDLSLAQPGTQAAFPMVAACPGRLTVAWFDDRMGGRWNVWARQLPLSAASPSWSNEVRLSNLQNTTGYSYKNADGFLFPYGDYGKADHDNQGNVQITWGEGSSWNGTGGVWWVRQLS